MRCFYDADEQVRLWGTYLAEELPRIYSCESAAVVVFISADYAAGDWTRLERRAAFSRAVAEAGVYILPARFDDSELPGLLPGVVTVDLRSQTPEQFAALIAAKLADLAISRGPAGGVRVGEEAQIEQTDVRIRAGMERERQPAPVVAVRAKFLNPPPMIAPRYFQDRYVETELIGAFLRDEGLRMMTVTGRSGIGKTAMVCRLLKALEGGRLPGDLGELAVGGIVYLCPAGMHPVNFPDLFNEADAARGSRRAAAGALPRSAGNAGRAHAGAAGGFPGEQTGGGGGGAARRLRRPC